MNNKLGDYIIKLRKEKGLTQQQLASKLGISNTAVSKWECGYNLPDISMIEPLSKVLDADMLEMLSYLNDTTITNLDNTENKTNKRRLIFIISLVVLLILNSLILIAFTITKANAKRKDDDNEIRVYELSSRGEAFDLSGYVIFNNKENIVIINKITYQDIERGIKENGKIQNIKIYLKIEDSTIFTYESDNTTDLYYTIDEIITNINFDNQEYYNTKINLYDLESNFSNTILKIECYEKDIITYENEQEILLLRKFI